MIQTAIVSVALAAAPLLAQSSSVRTSGPMAPSAVRKANEQMTTATTTRVPNFVLPEKYKNRTLYPLPAKHNFAAASPHYTPYDPTISGLWREQGMSCANATGVNVLFSHEANRARNFRPAPRSPSPEYTYQFTYHFLNQGDMQAGDFWMSFAVADILKEMGCPTAADFGGLEWGNSFGGWMSGYEKYYRAMQVRLDEYYDLDATAPGAEEAIKQVVYDHADGSQYGAAVQTHVSFSSRIDKRNMAGPNGPQTLVYYDYASGGGHSISIVGWDDTYLPELGGTWIMQDAYPVGLSYSPRSRWRDGGPLDFANGVGAPVLFHRIKKGYAPKVTFKVQITHNQRSNIAVMTGVGPADGTAPIAWKDYAGAFNYSGGPNPMGGRGQSATLEFGLDMTDFAPFLRTPNQKLYLMVFSKGGTGTIDKLSIMDYTAGAAKEIASTEVPRAIAPGTASAPARTMLAITLPVAVSIRDLAPPAKTPAGWNRGGRVSVRLTESGAAMATLNIRDGRGRTVFSQRRNVGGMGMGAEIEFPWSQGQASPGLYFATFELQGPGIRKSEILRLQVPE